MQSVNSIFDESVVRDIRTAIQTSELRDKCAAWRKRALWYGGVLMAHVLIDIAVLVFRVH